ncbi:MAG: Sugar-specific transcriptional regulator TrmB family [Candidatus Peregrinibacteria bacterium Greene0416_19]|nr:MAG: Sugar-specific transcriptional regulator TrmB family [Candidatus Peregrinibacteria bacterium Greene0416_19]
MHHLQPLLESIGLNHHESSIYLHLLSHGEQPASTIARQTKIPRSTTRGILDKLCERGIVGKLYKRNTQYYRCREATSLVRHLERHVTETQEQLTELNKALPTIEALHRGQSVVPKVRFYEGKEGVIEAFNHSLYVEGIQEILFMTSYRFLREPLIRKNDDDFYIPLRVRKGIRLRVIVGRTERTDKFSRHDVKELRERRFLADRYAFPGNVHIYGDYVAYFSAGEGEHTGGEPCLPAGGPAETMAVVVESALMAETMRAMFAFMWSHTE